MHAAPYPEVPADFGHWLAGFMDGESHFCIERRTRKASSKTRTDNYRTYSCRMQLALRADDSAALDEIVTVTGLGATYLHHTPSARAKGYTPIRYWYVSSQADCVGLIALLDKYPLRSKKARDYLVWRQAVLEWTSVAAPAGDARRGYEGRDWSRMAKLRDQIMEGRRYRE